MEVFIKNIRFVNAARSGHAYNPEESTKIIRHDVDATVLLPNGEFIEGWFKFPATKEDLSISDYENKIKDLFRSE